MIPSQSPALQSLLARIKAKNAAALIPSTPAPSTPTPEPVNDFSHLAPTGRTGESITYNSQQAEAIRLALEGKDCILLGAAGTGKTTTTQGIISALVQSGKAGTFTGGHKYLPKSGGTPGIVIIAFTRRAIANSQKFMSPDMQSNCLTHHKLVEYQPVYYEISDPKTGESKKTMQFEATRGPYNPLSSSIHTIIIEEASMFSTMYFKELIEACPHKPQIIFVGDIQQLPPVFGPAILGYKLTELPTVELTQVYRQALESPIIRLAHRILSGKGIPLSEFPEWQFPGQLTIKHFKKKSNIHQAESALKKMFCGSHTEHENVMGLIESGAYDPETDMILMPHVNPQTLGTDVMNKHIAQFLAKKNNSKVYEIIAGFNSIYLSIGDKVLYDKEDATVIDIRINEVYAGKMPQPASYTLDYWGIEHAHIQNTQDEMTDDELDILMDKMATTSDEDRVRAASHVVTVQMNDTGEEVEISSASALNNLTMAYALSVHKSQGSEWKRVYLILHQSHAQMTFRELLYTAVTRAKKELIILCEPEALVNGIRSQRIKGNTLAEKAEYFKGKKELNGGVY